MLFVDRNPSTDLVSGPRGRSVWPIRDEADWGAVSGACALRAITVTEVAGHPAVPARTHGAVVAFGDAAVCEMARLYAHLTGRAYMPDGLADLPGDAVVVTTFAGLTSDLLASLYSNGNAGAAPGLICATDAAGLRRQVLVRAISAVFPDLDADLPWTAIFPVEAVGARRRGDLRVLDGASPAAEVRDAITARSGLLAIATHSDGVDAMLAPSLVLCGISAGQLATPLDREPSCLVSNHCHRFGVPVAGVAELGATVTPADIATHVMVFDTCFGTLAADAPITIERGLGRQLVENLGIGALATTWELTILDPDKLQGLVADLRGGMRLGQAVARFNRSAVARRHAARLALFGDPRMRFTPRAAEIRKGVEPVAASPAPSPAMLQELAFSRACLEQGVADLSGQLASCGADTAPVRRQLAMAVHTLGMLRRFELACWRGVVDGESAATLRRALVEDAFVRRPFDDWKTFADKTDWSQCHCAGCGAPSWAGVLGVRVPGVSRRRVVLCPRCNLSEDMPAHVHINLRFDATTGMCRLAGKPPERDWSAALIVRTRNETHDRMWEWPAAPDGGPAEEMQMSEPLPPGPVRVAVILAHGGWLAWTATDAHGGPARGATEML